MGTAALVLGIIAICLAAGVGAAGFGWVGSICGLIAVILGAISSKNEQLDEKSRKNGKVGMILGIIALALGIVLTIACVACLGATAAALESY